MIYFGKDIVALCFGRILIGFGSGVSTAIVPLYISEISPLEQRGINGSFVQLSIVLGILISVIMGIPFSKRESWRELFAIAIIPILMQMILIPFIVESPLWLVMQNEHDHARASLQEVRGVDDVEEELQDIFRACGISTARQESNISVDESTSLILSGKKTIGFYGLWEDKTLWRPLLAAVGLQIIQQCKSYICNIIFRQRNKFSDILLYKHF